VAEVFNLGPRRGCQFPRLGKRRPKSKAPATWEDRMKGRILVVDDDLAILEMLRDALEALDWEVATAATAAEGLRAIVDEEPDAVLLDVMLPDKSGLDVLEEIKTAGETTPVVMMSGGGTIDVAVKAMRAGAEHFLQKPFDFANLEILLEQVSRTTLLRRRLAALQRELAAGNPLLPGSSDAISEVNELIHRVAAAPSPVLLEGESGTGKGMVSRLLHDLGPRRNAPRVEINCAGLSRELLESELFGHERGSFTGAQTAKQGLFEIASGGTLVLDEIGELELGLQARLLKALEDKVIRRVGGVRDMKVDVRLVAATNRSLEDEIRAGRFRKDLYFRLNVVRILLPPLRARMEDLPAVVQFLLAQLSRDLGFSDASISPRALKKLAGWHWPGNARELRNVLERALLIGGRSEIRAEDVEIPRSGVVSAEAGPMTEDQVVPLDEWTASYVKQAVEAVGGNVRKAARLLEVSPSTVYAKLKLA
jgi:DNA-binding NtrC family response regulator